MIPGPGAQNLRDNERRIALQIDKIKALEDARRLSDTRRARETLATITETRDALRLRLKVENEVAMTKARWASLARSIIFDRILAKGSTGSRHDDAAERRQLVARGWRGCGSPSGEGKRSQLLKEKAKYQLGRPRHSSASEFFIFPGTLVLAPPHQPSNDPGNRSRGAITNVGRSQVAAAALRR